ncbi:MAG: alpha/beta fold hydrolase [Alphaproteobacteria bacterium]|nr:alpha/beta fold hydrolase [Alphaproteobacteria bacterium]
MRLAVRVRAPEGRPVARCLLVHAMMVDARTMDRARGPGLASTLAEEGLEAWSADLRGHGDSDRPASWTYDDLVRRDLPALIAAASADGLPLVIVGHSLGAHVAAATIAEGARPRALVMIAGNVWRPSHEPSMRRRALKGALMTAFLASARARGRFPSRRLGIGTVDEATPYVEDLVRFWRTDRFASREGRDWVPALREVRMPVLAVAGAGDRLLASPDGVRRFADAFPPGCVDAWVVRRASGDWDADHMGLVTDVRSLPTWRRIAGWIRASADDAVP